ncbi:hypothetical protein CDL12_20313 [Handroanthus impetiginosus]|uniref:Auxin efflux carrier component n=1 Tax=Handroanthus impetiginosus TaxID=429701 RepID=A0A2G9GPC0_9LAMI|nr:hypothetical protein CDL12_20313 [Handroanthus impetiginosus]
MIGWEDVYKVVVAMVLLYVALGLGYGSVKWWRMFKPDHCDAINHFNAYFIIPFFTFQFTCNVDPYPMNYRFLARDVVAKAIAGVALALRVNLWKEANFSWAIRTFSIATLNNTLVVWVLLLKAMYGPLGKTLGVQSTVTQSLLWFPLLLFMLEFRHTLDYNSKKSCGPSRLSSIEIAVATNDANNISTTTKHDEMHLQKNPNIYACSLAIIWALLAKRWNFKIHSIVGGSIQIMAKARCGVGMFSMGLFMVLQEKVIACGMRLTIYNMAMRFVGGPLCMAIGAAALGFIFGTIISLPLLIMYYAISEVIQ